MGKFRNIIKAGICKFTPLKVKRVFFEEIKSISNFENLSYSQEGEDRVLMRFFEEKTKGFFVDVGAHHPTRFSNTYLFYLKGWRGINIDAAPGSMNLFDVLRPNDINLELPVSLSNQTLKYYIFNEPALNTFSESEAYKKNGLREYKILNTKNLKTYKLSQILDEHLPLGKHIDFMTIDVEGLDFEVLQSNDWQKYHPSIILVESLRASVKEIMSSALNVFLEKLGYTLVAKTYNTLFFKSAKWNWPR